MRHPAAFVLFVALLAPAAAHGEATPTLAPPPPVPLDAARSPLQVNIDLAKVDIAGHKLEVTLSHPAEKVRIKVIGRSGSTLAEVEKKFDGASAGTTLAMSWTPSSDEAVGKIEVWGYDTDSRYKGVAIIPWEAEIGNQETHFATDSDVIPQVDVPTLTETLKTVQDLVGKAGKQLSQPPTLFIFGHTDSVGTDEHNVQLSRRRARAIANWFRAHGLKLPIAYEGMGERMLLVKTADNVDEPKNRRVQYRLSNLPPSLPSKELSWKSL